MSDEGDESSSNVFLFFIELLLFGFIFGELLFFFFLFLRVVLKNPYWCRNARCGWLIVGWFVQIY